MTKSIFRICATLALALTASQTILLADEAQGLVGVWDVTVTVKDCQTGALIRTVRGLEMFDRNGSFTETANTFLRGISLGTWAPAGGRMFGAAFWFFRYKPDGTFASLAKVIDMIVLSQDGNHFSTSGTVQDFDATNSLISTGCFTHSATRLTAPAPGN
jgi:hypothetical protein